MTKGHAHAGRTAVMHNVTNPTAETRFWNNTAQQGQLAA